MNSLATEIPAAARLASDAAVLVIDDDPTSRLLISSALEGHVGGVVEAENGQEGLSRLSSGSFDIAVVDLDMPVMNGFGFIERARARPETQHLPIIVVTGRDDVIAIERAYSLGATSFLCKPLNWSIFRYQVAYVLQGARAEKARRLESQQSELRALFHARATAFLLNEAAAFAARFNAMREATADKAEDLSEAMASMGRDFSKSLRRIRRLSSVVVTSTLDIRAVKAEELVEMSLALARQDLGDESTLRVQVKVDASPDLVCSPELAAEALAQVIENALLFSLADQPVLVTIRATGPHRVRFEVRDSGEGVPEALLSAGRDGPAVAGTGGALGVGLALARNIVERHAGHFGVMSEPGRGTEVFLNFPSYIGVPAGPAPGSGIP